jgi:Uma2 family endonuclease
MAAQTQIPITEYLQTSYRPDREYINGELRERNVGLWTHARLLALLAAWCGRHEDEWGALGAISARVSVSTTRIRAPDLVLVRPGPQPDVLTEPPVLVIEILSPDDTYSDTEERAADYQQMGVETIWIIDPETRTGRMCIGASWTAAARLTVPGTPIYVELAEMFAQINPAES